MNGSLSAMVGPLLHSGEGYLPWLFAKTILGVIGDTILVALLEEGMVRSYGLATEEPVTEFAVTQYFKAVKPREEAVRFPWIQTGELGYVFDTPQIVLGTFGPNGYLYAVRPYGYRWVARPNPYVKNAGDWEVITQGLEVYNRQGHLLGAFHIPADVRSLHADGQGRLLISVASGDVQVYQNPVESPTQCRPRNIVLPDLIQ